MGSNRKFFGTDGVRGRVGATPMTAEFVLKLGWAIGKALNEKNYGHILIGKDTRISGYMLESALEAGISATGFQASFTGPIPTPAIAYLTRAFRADAGIVISASHNPYYDNGIKIFSKEGFKLSDELELRIEELLEEEMDYVDSANLGKALRINDASGRYIEFCKSSFPKEYTLKNLKIVVDCANGATYHIAGNVLKELGAEVIEINVSPNGVNINNKCGATNVLELQNKVLEEKADVGFAFDGDGDRLIAIDHLGNIVDGDNILYIIAKDAKSKSKLKGGVVGTEMSNLGLEKGLKELGIEFQRAAVGDRYVIEKLQELNWTLGGEGSGHIIQTKKNTTGDAIVACLSVLEAMLYNSETLANLASQMKKYPQYLINIPCTNGKEFISKHKDEVVSIAKKQLKDIGRVLLRASGTEPLIRIMVECSEDKKAQEVISRLENVVINKLNSFI